MKKPIILIAIAIVSLTACKKKACYQCTTTQSFSANTGLTPVQTTKSFCDWTRDDADEYEEENSSTTTTTVAGQQITETKATGCN